MCSARIAANEVARRHERHRPEKTLRYQIVDEYYPHFQALMEPQGRSIPPVCAQRIRRLPSVRPLGTWLLRARCEDCHHQRLVAFSCMRRGIRLMRLLLVSQL